MRHASPSAIADATIREQLGFDSAEQLANLQTDMNPFHLGKALCLGIEISSGQQASRQWPVL